MRKVNASNNRGGGRTNATIARNYYDDDDDDDDGWVHGGKYVPPPASSVPRASSSSKPHNGAAATAAAASTARNDETKASSPYSTLSPVSLCTPVPMEELYDFSSLTTTADQASSASSQRQRQQQPRQNNQHQRGETATRTPLTIQLQRLLRPTTPRVARPTTESTTSTMTIPASSYARTPQQHVEQQQQQQQPAPSLPIESFLRRSGLTPHLSYTLGNFLYQFLLLLVPIVDFLYESILSVWNTTLVTMLPNLVCDIIESICEMTMDFLHIVWRMLRFALPYMVWIVQTTTALLLAVGGRILWLLAIIIRGRKRAQESGLDSMQSSAIKSLKESVRNSPFGKNSDGRRRLPFSGFTNRHNRVPPPPRDDIHDMLASSIATSSTTTRIIGNGNGVVVPPRSSSTSSKSTPTNTTAIASAMRSSTKRTTTAAATPHHRNSTNSQSVSHNSTSNAPATSNNVRTPSTATTRRVLFFETEAGEVVTDVTTYDKHMPASARKDRDYSLSRENYPDDESGGELCGEVSTRAGVMHEAAVGTTALDDRQLRKGRGSTASSDSTLPSPAPKKPTREVSAQPRPTSILGERSSSSQLSSLTTAGQMTQHLQQLLPSKNSGEGTAAGDRKEQQYTITPLSKRYARLKLHQQQQQRQKEQQSGQLPSISDTAANNNPKRKRRGDLIGAASRLGRQRRARLMTTTTVGAHPMTFLDRNRTPKRRRDDDDLMARTDELIWRALNHDEKENNRVVQEGGSVAKRGKFNSDCVNDAVTSTPSKTHIASSSTAVSQIMTPPKSPEPSKFNWASSVMATPGLKKVSGRGEDGDEDRPSAAAGSVATPFKHSLPLTFDDEEEDADQTRGPTKISFGGTKAADTKVNASISSVAPAFSFVSSAVAKEGTSEAKISFGNSSGISSVTKTTESQQSSSAAPSAVLFGQSAAPSVAGQAKDVAPSSAFSASSVGVTSVASFSFGSTAEPTTSTTPAPAAFSQPAATALAFGSSGLKSKDAGTTKASSALTTTPALFGSSSQPESSAPLPAIASQPASSMFGFGNAAIPSSSTVSTPSTGALSFGTGAILASSAAGAAFAFGTPSQSAATAAAPSSTFSFGATNVTGGSAVTSASGLSTQPTSTFAFGAPSQTASSTAAPFSFAATNPTTGGAAIPTPDFGAASTNTFRLGGGASSSGGGASARRRAAKASGRRI